MSNGFTRWLNSRADLVMRVIVVVSLAVGLVVAVQHRTLARCLAEYNEDFANSTEQRSQAAEKDRQAEDSLWFAIDESRSLPPAEARAKSLAAFNSYIKQRREADRQRRENPPPPPPSQRCD